MFAAMGVILHRLVTSESLVATFLLERCGVQEESVVIVRRASSDPVVFVVFNHLLNS